ncbi:acetyl-CoA carboxylase [Pantoea sp. 18069]|uniref:acetyl-CoA carboxylase n=1 Tax=Pantoea sp. 18069 TaxID=2681415 RepID=UPI001356F083|nr:acetyl-CoA carboxylase [Pantoea sp. 18069]
MEHPFVERLFDLFEQSGALEMEYLGPEGSLRLTRAGSDARPVTPALPAPSTPAAQETPPQAGPARHAMAAPLSGNFYRASAPDAAPFAQVGAIVEQGQVLGLIETMKMLNEVEAEHAGRIISFAIANGQAVQAGAALLVIEALESAHV